MALKVNHNGELVSGPENVLRADNRAFLYGDALFETIRVVGGQPCFLSDHVERLHQGMALLRFEKSAATSLESLAREIGVFLSANEFVNARVRLTVYRNNGGLYTPKDNGVSFLIDGSALESEKFEMNTKGLVVDLFEANRKSINAFSNLKTTSSMLYVLAGMERQDRGLDDCLVMNELGNVIEAVSSNVVMVANRVLYTPSADQGAIAGVMKKQVFRLAAAAGFEVQEAPLRASDLMRADELLLTNSIKGIQWVGAYRGKRFFHSTGSLLLERLNAAIPG